MKRFLSSKIYSASVAIGLDLDGTLYDEFDFVEQVYGYIVKTLSNNRACVEDFMLERWIQEGSSYPKIFLETQRRFGLADSFEEKALKIYRAFSPDLRCSRRAIFVLRKFKRDKKRLFLLTDGHRLLQNRKIDSLGIRKYFDRVIVAEMNKKPDPLHGQQILKSMRCLPSQVIYVGDRDVDREFAKNCSFRFIESRFVI